MSDPTIQRGYRVSGRVQGVGFRWWTRSAGAKLALSGTVRNLHDGSVEVHVRGPENVVREFESLLHEGPWSADVGGVMGFDSAEALPDDFEVRF